MCWIKACFLPFRPTIRNVSNIILFWFLSTRWFIQAVTYCFVAGNHRRVQQESWCQRGWRHRQVQGGECKVSEVVRDARRGEAGQLLLLQLLEGEGSSAGMALPQHQPPLLLFIYTGKRRLHINSFYYEYAHELQLIIVSFRGWIILKITDNKK